MRKFVTQTPNVFTWLGRSFHPDRGKILLSGLLLCLFCFQSFGQDKSAKPKAQPSVKPVSANQVATPLKPVAETEFVTNKPLEKKFEGYLVLVKNNDVALTEDVPVPFRGAKVVAVKGNPRVTVLKFDDLKTMKHWAPAYHDDLRWLRLTKRTW